MQNISDRLRRSRAGAGLAFGLAMIAAAIPAPGSGTRAAAQGSNPCAVLTADDVKPMAVLATVEAGVAASFAPAGYSACRYAWGAGLNRYKLEVSVSEGSRMFTGASADGIKQSLLATVRPETADGVIPDVGDAAVFKAESPVYAYATAFVKGRIVQVHLDGLDARTKKDQVIALLKTAASRL
ncbi:MAG TPA: hypothetical protein VJN96_21535 [Vicinamibacterales bacterium]|nr:hypothetical protein [Vicinamibacterales bacterium]